MFHKSMKSIAAILMLALLVAALFGCGGAAPAQPAKEEPAKEEPAAEAPAAKEEAPAATEEAAAEAPAGEAIKVGLSFSDFATERWKNEEELMRKLLEEKGYEVVSQEANHDVKLQNDQIDNMVAQGVKALIVIAEDGDAAVTAVDKAAEAGVKVLAYDRLIKSPNIAAYLSFNNVEVGRQQALGVMKAIDIEGGKWTADNPLKLVKLGGSPTDNNAILFRKGQDEIVDPYVEQGIIEVVADQWVDNWDPANALSLMENILTSQSNAVDAVVASNDGTALGALQALKAQKLAGVVPISGQDATADGCNSIVKGELTVTILKDIRNLSPLAVDLVDKLLKDETIPELKKYTMAELTNDEAQQGEVAAYFLPVEQVDAGNVDALCVENGFQKAEDVYRDVEQPAAETAAPTGEGIKIGLSFSDFATERWKNEEELMRRLLEEKGYEVLSQEANHDVKLQNDQIDNMVAQGVKGLIVIAEDGDAASTAVAKAAEAGVKVLAYDRLIKSPDIAAYLSFNNVEVGRQQALGVMKAIDIEGGKWTADNPLKLVKLGGSPTDNNAILFRKGQDEIVDPYVEQGIIEVVADQWVDNWDPANALSLMENILTSQSNAIDAVVASNDGTALGALQALKAQKLAGVVPISGQDATADGCNSIVKGELTVTILKDIRNLSPLAVDLMDKLLQGETIPELQTYTMAELTNDEAQQGEVSAYFLPVEQVDAGNVDALCVENGFQKAEDVYRDVEQPAAEESAAEPAMTGEGIKVGLSFSDFATERWKNEEELMRRLLEEKGYEVLSQEANHDVKLQNDQIDNMVAQGVKALIVIAEDGDAASTAVAKAAEAGVKVLAYDRLIKSPDIAAYLSFNNVEVGRQQALGVMEAVDIEGGKWTADNPLKLVKLGGSPTDNNAILFRKGQDEIVDPYVEQGIIEVVADQWVDNWDPANALSLMENILTSQSNAVDAVVASNDGTALGALQALKAQKLAGVVPISGQDATADGCNSIVKGELTVSILKDIRNLSPLAVDLMDKLLQGETIPELKTYTMAELTNDEAQQGEVSAYFLPVEQVNQDNVYDLVVKSAFQAYDDVYRDIPEDQLPPKP